MGADLAEIRRAIELDADDVAAATANVWIRADHVCRQCQFAMAAHEEIDPAELVSIAVDWLRSRSHESLLAKQARDLIAAAAQALLLDEAAKLHLLRKGLP